MPQPTYYDTIRFLSEEQATKAGEIYRADYIDHDMIITDPDGKKSTIHLNFAPIFGFDVSDHGRVMDWIDSDMEKRAATIK